MLTVARVVERFAGERVGLEFSSPEAFRHYLQEHPNADRSRHTVKKPEEKGKTDDGDGKSPRPKALFDPKEVEHLPEVIRQKIKDPDRLFEQAAEAHEQQLDWLNHGKGLDKAIGAKVVRRDKGEEVDFDQPGPVVVIGAMKRKERAKEKVDADFGGDWSHLGDIVRASVAVDSMDQIENVMAHLRKTGLKVARKPKDRFAKPTEAGYRDLMMNVEYPNGHIGELQLHLKPILKAKSAGHKLYEEVRSIEAKAKAEQRNTLTPEESKAIDEANRKMRELYDEAWARAASRSKTASMDRRAPIGVTGLMDPPTGKTAAETKYYDYEGLPAWWAKGKFPMIQTITGKTRVVYTLQKFFHTAQPISKEDFEKLKESAKDK